MAFIKTVKNKAYFKRFQVQYRRRRECKTDYTARRRLVIQDKDKYQSPKYRFVVRVTNSDVICQVMYSKVVGDQVLCAAYAHELPRYGVKLGLTNYAAAYATGLLLARRLLAKLQLDKVYTGVKTADGKEYLVEPKEDGPRPFKAVLDVGLIRTTTGNRTFGALKGALDGGLNIPHSEKRFPGFKGEKYDPAVHRKYIFGGHVAGYMTVLQKEDPERYQTQFSRYIKEGIKPNDLESIYKKAHEAIKKDPSAAKKPAKAVETHKNFRSPKLTREEKKRITQAKKDKIRELVEGKRAAQEVDEEEDDE